MTEKRQLLLPTLKVAPTLTLLICVSNSLLFNALVFYIIGKNTNYTLLYDFYSYMMLILPILRFIAYLFIIEIIFVVVWNVGGWCNKKWNIWGRMTNGLKKVLNKQN